MAAPATHIILAKKVFDKYCPDKNEADFFRGTEFADIRYIANIDRNLTHFMQVTLDEIINADAFTAGLKTHSLVDLTREKAVIDAKLYDIMPESKYLSQILKCYEDQLIYNQVSDWQKYVDFFDQVSDLELTFGITQQTILQWHSIISESLSTASTDEKIILFLSKKMGLNDAEKEIIPILNQLKQKPNVKETFLNYVESFEQIIEKY